MLSNGQETGGSPVQCRRHDNLRPVVMQEEHGISSRQSLRVSLRVLCSSEAQRKMWIFRARRLAKSSQFSPTCVRNANTVEHNLTRPTERATMADTKNPDLGESKLQFVCPKCGVTLTATDSKPVRRMLEAVLQLSIVCDKCGHRFSYGEKGQGK